jgi:hypothetical protein
MAGPLIWYKSRFFCDAGEHAAKTMVIDPLVCGVSKAKGFCRVAGYSRGGGEDLSVRRQCGVLLLGN